MLRLFFIACLALSSHTILSQRFDDDITFWNNLDTRNPAWLNSDHRTEGVLFLQIPYPNLSGYYTESSLLMSRELDRQNGAVGLQAGLRNSANLRENWVGLPVRYGFELGSSQLSVGVKVYWHQYSVDFNSEPPFTANNSTYTMDYALGAAFKSTYFWVDASAHFFGEPRLDGVVFAPEKDTRIYAAAGGRIPFSGELTIKPVMLVELISDYISHPEVALIADIGDAIEGGVYYDTLGLDKSRISQQEAWEYFALYAQVKIHRTTGVFLTVEPGNTLGFVYEGGIRVGIDN